MARPDVTAAWSNVNCERDIVDAMVWNRRLLRVLGIWPLVCPDVTRTEKILATVLLTLSWSGLSFLMIPMSIYTFSERTGKTVKIKMLGPLGHVLVSILKYFFLMVRCRDIRQCIRALSVDWRAVEREDHRETMMRDVAKGHTLSKFFMVFMYSGGLFYNIVMPFLSHRPDGERNVSVGPTAYPGYDSIFDLRFMPTYVLVFCAQVLSAAVMFNINTAMCCLASTLVGHACGQIEVMMTRVECLVKNVQNNNNMNFGQHMAVIVKHHVRALRFSVYIEKILCEICLFEIVASTFFMCMCEYYFITEWNNSDSIAILTYFFLLTSFVFNIFIFCYISEQLTNQYNKIGYASYKIEWYHLPGKVALDLILLMCMSHRPVKISAGKLMDLSYITFGNVVKTSIVYLNLLRTVA